MQFRPVRKETFHTGLNNEKQFCQNPLAVEPISAVQRLRYVLENSFPNVRRPPHLQLDSKERAPASEGLLDRFLMRATIFEVQRLQVAEFNVQVGFREQHTC